MKMYKVKVWKIVGGSLLAICAVKMMLVMYSVDRISLASRTAAPNKPSEKLSRPIEERQQLKSLLHENANRSWALNDSCAPYPRFEDLHFENQYYQYSRGGNVSYYLYGAYYDRRVNAHNSPAVVVLAMMSNYFGPFELTYCQLWYEHSGRPELVELGTQNFGWYAAWGTGPDHVYPTVFTCPLAGGSRRHRVPQLVSLVFGDRCARARNALHVFYKAPQRRRSLRFGVCVKDLQYPNSDVSERMIEWLELMRILGAERVTVYDLGGKTMHPNTRRTLRHYEEQDGLLQIRPFRLIEGLPKPAQNTYLSKVLNEVLMYNDCLYRSLYEFDYLAVMDMDEVIMPLGELRNWTSLVQALEQNTNDTKCLAHCSMCFRNVYFSKYMQQDETPPARFYMLRHVERVANHLDGNSAIKCLHATAYVTILHNHFPLNWLEVCAPRDVSTAIGQMQHYREPDDKATLKVPKPVRDYSIWRFKDQLMHNAQAKYRRLGWPLT